jgi:dTDP-4-amino-4,6-dideoxygalactose transaminase
MCFLLCDLKPGDEVIMPSFTFVSAANAVVLRGAIPVFIDIRPDDMNIDERLLEAAITQRTRAVLVMHYGGVSCQMHRIVALAKKYGLWVIEDTAHGIGARWRDAPLGINGDVATISFHATKNIHSGEGGALLINRTEWIERARQIRDKGTNRAQMMSGVTGFYTWTTIGSSYVCSELTAAFLAGQLPFLTDVTQRHRALWDRYYSALQPLAEWVNTAQPDVYAEHNGHLFFIRLKDTSIRDGLIQHFKADGIDTRFHYVPLHSSPAGMQYGRWHGEDVHTTIASHTLLRLPLYYSLTEDHQERVIDRLHSFFRL